MLCSCAHARSLLCCVLSGFDSIPDLRYSHHTQGHQTAGGTCKESLAESNARNRKFGLMRAMYWRSWQACKKGIRPTPTTWTENPTDRCTKTRTQNKTQHQNNLAKEQHTYRVFCCLPTIDINSRIGSVCGISCRFPPRKKTCPSVYKETKTRDHTGSNKKHH